MRTNSPTDEFITKAKIRHNNLYTYEKVVYINSRTKICITCKEHGTFMQRASAHLDGQGCALCNGNSKISKQQFIENSTLTQNNLYVYDDLEWPINANNKTILKITCKLHGPFEQRMSSHMHGVNGCIDCKNINISNAMRYDITKFTEIANMRHDNYYDYSKSLYIDSYTPIRITCPKHGEFLQTPKDHLRTRAAGCPSCSRKISDEELELSDYINDLLSGTDINVITNSKKIIPPLELDIYIPTFNIAFEYCGLYWHTEKFGKDAKYHANKYTRCKDAGIQLITIFSDEWKDRRQQVENKIRNLLHMSTDTVIYARNTTVKEVPSSEKKKFLDDNHIQGNGQSSINIGLYNADKLIAVAAFNVQGNKTYLNRYATSARVVGGSSKLIKYFERNYEFTELISFADLRWSDGNLYEQTGWKLESIIPPDYSYVCKSSTVRRHKFNYRRSRMQKDPNIIFDPSKTEYQNCLINNIYRIWDCGKLRYIKTP